MTKFIFNTVDRMEATKSKLEEVLQVIKYYEYHNNLKFYKEDLQQIKNIIFDVAIINGLDIQ